MAKRTRFTKENDVVSLIYECPVCGSEKTRQFRRQNSFGSHHRSGDLVYEIDGNFRIPAYKGLSNSGEHLVIGKDDSLLGVIRCEWKQYRKGIQ